jgi:LemA protein
MSLWIILGLLAIIVLWGISVYNQLIKARNLIKNSFAQIDVQLKRRYELIPNLVETARAYLKHERETLEAVTQARNQAAQAEKALAANPTDLESMKKFNQAESGLGGALGRLIMTMEAYPDLKGNQNMAQLMEELSSTENKVSFARQAFNDAVLFFNNLREVFPNSVIAGLFNFTPAQPLEIENPVEREAIKVKF